MERFIELLHKDTLDSYRVRTHNVYTLLEELQELLIGWGNNQIKQFETIKFCIEEVKEAIKEDTCLEYSYCSKAIFIQELETCMNSGEKDLNKSKRVIMLLHKIIVYNKEKYLQNLFNSIEKILFGEGEFEEKDFMGKAELLDAYTSALCRQLLHIGYSKVHLYVYLNKLDYKSNFSNIFKSLKNKFLSLENKEFIVIFKLSFPDKIIKDCEIPELKSQIEEDLNIPEFYAKFTRAGKSVRFYIHKCNSVDSISAIKIAKEKLSSLLDVLHLGLSRLSVEIPDTALVLTKNEGGTYVYERKTQFLLDWKYSDSFTAANRFKGDLDKIRANSFISQSVKDRLEAALRHLRIGNVSSELEQRFINYWIALEFIFSSPETNENTYNRLKTNLINILASCYIKRNLLALNEVLIKEKSIDSGTLYWEYPELDKLIDDQKSILMKYRLKKIKSRLFNHKDKFSDYLKRHEKNLLWHIARIYRLRNQLIHEAAIKQDIENVTSNLRYYLVFLLNQIIIYFVNTQERRIITLEDFFFEYDIYKKSIFETKDLTISMEVPVEMDLLV